MMFRSCVAQSLLIRQPWFVSRRPAQGLYLCCFAVVWLNLCSSDIPGSCLGGPLRAYTCAVSQSCGSISAKVVWLNLC